MGRPRTGSAIQARSRPHGVPQAILYTRVGTITILGFSLAEIAGMFDQTTDAADVHSALKFRSDTGTRIVSWNPLDTAMSKRKARKVGQSSFTLTPPVLLLVIPVMLCCGWAIYQVPQKEKLRFMMYGRQQRLAVAGAAGYNKLGDYIDIDARLLSASSLPPSVQEFGPEITPSTFQDAASLRKPFVVRDFVPSDSLQQKAPHRSLEQDSLDPSGDFKGYFSEMGLKWSAVPIVGVIEDVRQGSWNASKNMLTPCHYDDVDNVVWNIRGRKIFLLFPPEDQQNLYMPHSADLTGIATTTPIVLEQPDLLQFPRFELTAPSSATMEADDVLFLPAKWSHHVYTFASESKPAFAINFWSVNIDANASAEERARPKRVRPDVYNEVQDGRRFRSDFVPDRVQRR